MFTEAFERFVAWREINGDVPHPEWVRMADHDLGNIRQPDRKWAEQEALRDALIDSWADYYQLKRTALEYWQCLFNRPPPRGTADSRPPGSDHTSVWRRRVEPGRGRKPTEVFVSQPYGFEHHLPEMTQFANEHGLCFWVGKRPSWYWPNTSIVYIEWARPDSGFAKRRDTAEADRMHRTLYRHGP